MARLRSKRQVVLLIFFADEVRNIGTMFATVCLVIFYAWLAFVDSSDVCKKDILILLDTSNSVGLNHLTDEIKPFLIRLITSKKLNVGPNGTHLALLTFSDEKNTKMRFGFGEKKTTQDYVNYINKDLVWSKISGSLTMTGTGAKIANTQVFPYDSPLNARPNIADIVLLITDGKPQGQKRCCELENALKHTSSMKNKSILIIGIVVGKPHIRMTFNHTILKMSSSNSTLFNCDFLHLDKILDRLINASCTSLNSECICQSTRTLDYVNPNCPCGTKSVTWMEPKPTCPGQQVVRNTIQPNVKPGASFGVGNHTILYSYNMTNGINVQCTAAIEVKVVPCQSVPYNPATHMCCSGELHSIKPHYKCCGRGEYNYRVDKCCPLNSNVVGWSDICPGDDSISV